MHRRIAAAFAFASLAGLALPLEAVATDTPSRPFHAFLPGIAMGEPASTAPPSPVEGAHPLAPQHVSLRTEGINGTWISGEVLNTTGAPIGVVTLEVRLGGFTRPAETRLAFVAPGQSTPFSVNIPVPPGSDAPTITVTGYDATPSAVAAPNLTSSVSGPTRVDAGIPDPRTGFQATSPEVYAFDGHIVNESDRPWSLDEVVLTVYDGAGNVAVVAAVSIFDYPEGAAVLLPGKSAGFRAFAPIAAFLAIDGPSRIVASVNATPA